MATHTHTELEIYLPRFHHSCVFVVSLFLLFGLINAKQNYQSLGNPRNVKMKNIKQNLSARDNLVSTMDMDIGGGRKSPRQTSCVCVCAH